MLQLIRCALCLMVLVLVFIIWGYSVSKRLKITLQHLPMQILLGFFAFFLVMQLIIIPIVFLHNSLHLATVLVVGISILITVWMLWTDRLGFWKKIKRISITPYCIATLGVLGLMMLLAVLQSYAGYDACYYVGEMNAFLHYGKFWTRDAFLGLAESSVPPLHYALSCFYPLFSIMSYLFQVDARLMAMYTVRALCVLLFACVAYCWGYSLFERRKDDGTCEQNRHRNGCLFTVICLMLSLFLLDYHSSAFMMMVRGYESKGYCAAVVAPMCAYALIQLCREMDSSSHWRLLGLVAWSSVPIAMSSMAVIPFAIAIVGLTLMIVHKNFWGILIRCLICVMPNMLWFAWYVLGK